MGHNAGYPVDHARTSRPRAGEAMKDGAKTPGLLLIAAGVVAFASCLASFALRQVGVGVAAVVIALLAGGAGLAWLGMDGRQIRDAERHRLAKHHHHHSGAAQ